MFKSKLPGLMIDFLTIFLIFVYYQTCQFWALAENVQICLSKETERKLIEYAKLLKSTSKLEIEIKKQNQTPPERKASEL